MPRARPRVYAKVPLSSWPKVQKAHIESFRMRKLLGLRAFSRTRKNQSSSVELRVAQRPFEPQANGQEVKYMYFTYLARRFSQLGAFSCLITIRC